MWRFRNRKTRWWKWASWLAGCNLLPVGPLWANHCVVNVQGLNFGVYQAFDPTPALAQSGVEVVCEEVVPFQVSLDAGLYANGDPRDRRMLGPTGSRLRYNLYLDAGASQVWGEGSAGTAVFTGLAGGESLQVPVYGRLAPGQLLAPGEYSDTVMVTISW